MSRWEGEALAEVVEASARENRMNEKEVAHDVLNDHQLLGPHQNGNSLGLRPVSNGRNAAVAA